MDIFSVTQKLLFGISYVDVDTSVRLFYLEDEKFVDWLLGEHCDLAKHQDIENNIMYPELLKLAQRLFHKHGGSELKMVNVKHTHRHAVSDCKYVYILLNI